MTDIAMPKSARRFARKPNTDPKPAIDVSPRAGEKAAPAPSTATVLEPAAKPETKSARVIALLQRKEGATLEEMVTATGWLPHTTRAAMTGLKRKGHTITSVKAGGVRRYHAGAASASAAQ